MAREAPALLKVNRKGKQGEKTIDLVRTIGGFCFSPYPRLQALLSRLSSPKSYTFYNYHLPRIDGMTASGELWGKRNDELMGFLVFPPVSARALGHLVSLVPGRCAGGWQSKWLGACLDAAVGWAGLGAIV